MIDLEQIQSRLDRAAESLTDTYDLLREVERLRGEVERERAAVVAWLRRGDACCVANADRIERGEHHSEEGK